MDGIRDTTIYPNTNNKKEKKRNVFEKPSVEEVTAYCVERNNHVDPLQWHSFYESKGWVIGRAPMKDWKAAIRYWERNNGNGKGQPSIDRSWRD